MPRIIRSRPASSNPTYGSSTNYLWWGLGLGGLAWLLWGRRATATVPVVNIQVPSGRQASSTANTQTGTGRLPEFRNNTADPSWVTTGGPMVRRLYSDQVSATEFYLQSMLYASGATDMVPDGAWSSAWNRVYSGVASQVALPDGIDYGTPQETVFVVNQFDAAPRLVPVRLPQPLIDAINNAARRLWSGATPLQVLPS